MLSDPVAEAFGLIHRHPSGENLWYGMDKPRLERKSLITNHVKDYICKVNTDSQQNLENL